MIPLEGSLFIFLVFLKIFFRTVYEIFFFMKLMMCRFKIGIKLGYLLLFFRSNMNFFTYWERQVNLFFFCVINFTYSSLMVRFWNLMVFFVSKSRSGKFIIWEELMKIGRIHIFTFSIFTFLQFYIITFSHFQSYFYIQPIFNES